jgi:hypothetical protein
MRTMTRAMLLALLAGAGCTEPDAKRVQGSMKFVVGGTAPVAPVPASGGRSTTAVTADEEYIVSPRQAKITFTSVNFKDATGSSLGETALTDCTVVYDRTLSSGTTLLDCPFTLPVGEVAQMQLFYDTTLELLVSDPTVGVYSNPAVTSKFSTAAPAGGASYVPYTITIGGGTTRSGTVIFSSPVTVAEGSTPNMYVTLDMIHTIQLKVNADGTTLTAHPLTDPVVIFGGLTPGTSRYYSAAAGIDGYKVQGIATLRVFFDNADKPLFVMIGPNFCGADGGSKAAWASPPAENSMIGGWLGKDATNTIAFALPATQQFTSYVAYYVMADQSTIGQSTTLHCKVTSSPPPPADGNTYASGAPALTGPDKSVALKLIAR